MLVSAQLPNGDWRPDVCAIIRERAYDVMKEALLYELLQLHKDEGKDESEEDEGKHARRKSQIQPKLKKRALDKPISALVLRTRKA